jgi:hypothetical protein
MQVRHFTKAAKLTSIGCLALLLAGCPAMVSQYPGLSEDRDLGRIGLAPQGEAELEAELSTIVVDSGPYELSGVASLGFSPGGENLAVGSTNGSLFVFKVASGKEFLKLPEGSTQRPVPHSHPLLGGLSNPDGRTVVRMFSAGEIHIWDVVERRLAKRIAACGEYSVDQGTLAAKSRFALRTRPKPALVNLDTEKIVVEYPVSGSVSWTALSDDGQTAALVVDDDWIAIFRSLGDPKAEWLEGVRSRVRVMSFSPDARWLAVSTEDGVGIWSVDRKTMEVAVTSGERETWCLVWTPDQRWLVGGTKGGRVVIWEAWTGKQVSSQTGYYPCAVSPDSRVIASVYDRHIVGLWRPWARLDREAKAKVSGSSLDELWNRLGAAEASVAYRAMPALIARPAEAVPLIREKLIQEPPPQERVQTLIDALDEDDPNVREGAMRDLADLGNWVKKDLERVLSDSPTPEQAGRIRALQEDRPSLRCDSPDVLRKARAIHVLELIGTDAVLEVLRELAGSPCPVFLSDMAQAALRRLTTGKPGGR